MMGSAWSEAKPMVQDLRGKHYIVTGANTGLGYITARELAKMGAKVTLACRSAERGRKAIDRLREEALANPAKEGINLQEGLRDVDVELEILDLGSFQSIISFAQRFKALGSKADVLINNAGVFAIPDRRVTADGLELHMGVNHFGGHFLTRLMEPMIADGGRVLFLSSIAHRKVGIYATTLDWDNLNYDDPGSYNRWVAYGRTKLANILDCVEFGKRLAGRKINTFAVQPGVVDTGVFQNVVDSYRPFLFGERVIRWWMATPLVGSLTILRCAVDPSLDAPEFSGKYWGNLKEETPSVLALDPANPSRMWAFTENVLETKLGKKVDEFISS